MSVVRALLAGVLSALALGALPAGADASGDLRTGMADDRVLLQGDDVAVRFAAQLMAGMGVDTVRLHARWIAIAPRPNDARMPKGFRSEDPDDPGYNWGPLDRAVRTLRQVGIEPILSVTGSGPLWTSRNPARGNPRWKPDPRLFGRFAAAVAERYAADVRRYLVWNEPNIPGWLQPQQTCRAGRCAPASPHLYRELFRNAAAGIRRRDPTSEVLFGTLAPRGGRARSENATVRPLAFLRAMGCVTRTYARDRSGPCRGARGVVADGFAYHPHPVLRAPDEPAPVADDAAIADLGRLERVLDRTTRAGIVKPRTGARFDLHLTEFGYQTNPPDPHVGVSPALQARWVQQSTYLAWRDPRIRTIIQYELADEPLVTNRTGTDRFSGWQSGLLFGDGRRKPLASAFPNPFWVDVRPGRSAARFWGQVRPGGEHRVQLQRRTAHGWIAVRSVETNAFGSWTALLPVRAAATYRYTWRAPRAGGRGAVVRASLPQAVQPRR